MSKPTSSIPPKAERPRCRGCGKPLRVESNYTYERVERPLTETEQAQMNDIYRHGGHDDSELVAPTTAVKYKAVSRGFVGYREYDGFHSLRCALDFARDAYNAGFRRKPHKGTK